MRLALCNEVIRDLEFARQCELAAALGYDGIELAPFTISDTPNHLPAARVTELRRSAADAGLKISGLHWLLIRPEGLSLTSADSSTRAKTLDVMRRLVDLCAELGGVYLVHGSPAQRQLPADDPAQARAWVEAAFCVAGEAAGAAGVTYCVEPLAPRLTNCFNTVAEAAEFVARAGIDGLRTMLDTSAARLGEADPPDVLLKRWLPSGLIAHVHLNDANQRGPGQGDDPFAPTLRILRDHGWAGWIGIEPFDYVPDGPTCAARAIGFVRGIEESLLFSPNPSRR
jgi:sugar phosphate isomerase/epimerase